MRIISFGFYFLFLDYSRVIASTDATNVDNDTGVTFSSCITVFPGKPLSLKFPTRTFANDPKERSFKPQWLQKYPWLNYDVTLDKAFCHTCIKATKLRNISATKS